MQRKAARYILTRMTYLGRVPALLNTTAANALVMPCLLSAAAIANPPKSTKIVPLNMLENTALDASAAFVGFP